MLQAGLTQNNGIVLANVDRMGISLELRKYKNKNGSENFGELIQIPNDQRIPAMAEKNMQVAVATVAVAVSLALETMNLKNPMTPVQIVDLAEAITESSSEDQLSMQDLMLFLQNLTRGKYGELYNAMDAPKLMGFLDKYRDERWEEGVRIRDAKHEEYKNLGDPERKGRKMTAFEEHLSSYATKLQAKNDQIKELREERKRGGA